MSRLNLTLTDDTLRKLQRGAKARRVRVATYTRKLIEDALAGSERAAFLKKLASDYAKGRSDALELLKDLEAGQHDLLIDD